MTLLFFESARLDSPARFDRGRDERKAMPCSDLFNATSSFGRSLRWDCILLSAHVWLLPRRLREKSAPSAHSEVEILRAFGQWRRAVSVCAFRSLSFSLEIIDVPLRRPSFHVKRYSALCTTFPKVLRKSAKAFKKAFSAFLISTENITSRITCLYFFRRATVAFA